MDNITKAEQLIQQIPVNKKQAEKLLAQTHGNITEAIEIHLHKMTTIFMQKTPATFNEAKKYLIEENYHLPKAIARYENDKYTKTQLIIRKENDKERALDKIEQAIVETQKLPKDHFWVAPENMENLNEPQHLIVRLINWINWESWEGDLALYHDIAHELKRLNITWLSEPYDKCLNRIKEIQHTQHKIWEDKTFQKLYDTFLSRREELINTLYYYAVQHIDQLP